MGDELINTMGTLADWLERYNWEIYYNQKNRDNRPVFHANTNSKPDMLLKRNQVHILIEAKPGTEHQDILNGYQQTLDYAGEYWIGRTNYKIEEDININVFVLATKYSISGYLYNDEGKQRWMSDSHLKKTKNLVEKPITHSVTRLMWRQWDKGKPESFFNLQRQNRLGEGINCPASKPRVGTLLSRVDRNHKVTGEPHLFLNSNTFLNIGEEGVNNFLY